MGCFDSILRHHTHNGPCVPMRLIVTNVEECDTEVIVFRTEERAQNAENEVKSWGWSGIWRFEDSVTKYGIFLGERSKGQSCTADVTSAFSFALSR